MLRRRAAVLAVFLVAAAFAGCANRCACVGSGGGCPPASLPPGDIAATRGVLSADLSAVAPYSAVDRLLGPPPGPSQYRVLRAEDIQCLAAANAPLANLYASESNAVQSGAGCHNQPSACVLSKLAAYRAADERNKNAANALELFYALAEAQIQRDILDRTLAEFDRALGNLDQLQQSGLKMPADRTAVARQRLDALDRRIACQSSIGRFEGQLQQLCGLAADSSTAIWPQADLVVAVAPTDAQAAVAEGLAHRADLGALQMLARSLSLETLPAVRSGMQALGPGLGASLVSQKLFGAAGGQDELPSRQSQVAQACSEAERNAAREIAEAAGEVDARLREIAVSKERWELWRQRLAGLQQKRQTDGVTAFDLTAAQLELLRAESDVVHRVVAWRIAQVRLKRAQGLLAAECGSGLP